MSGGPRSAKTTCCSIPGTIRPAARSWQRLDALFGFLEDAARGEIVRPIRDHHQPVGRIFLGQEGSHVLVEAIVQASHGKEDGGPRQVRAEGHPQADAHAAPEQDTLAEAREVREEGEEPEDGQGRPEPVHGRRVPPRRG